MTKSATYMIWHVGRRYSEDQFMAVRPETKRTFAADLTAINWSSLYRLPTCQEQFDAFMSVLNSLIEEHFPTTTAVRHSNDKPWVTKGFKALVQDRQKALHEGDTETYRRLRYKINRQRSRLRASFYQSKVDKIGESNSRQWWKTIKTMIGLQPSNSHLCDLADQLCGGDTLSLANDINMVFKEVTSDLQPLLPAAASVDHDVPDEFIISVTDCEQKLSKLCVHKAMGPDNIRTGFSKTSPTFSLLQSQPSTTARWDKAMCRHRGSRLKYFPSQKSHRWHHWPNTYAPSRSPQYCPRCWSRLSCPGWGAQCTVKLSAVASKTAPPPLHSSRCYTMCSNVWRDRTRTRASCKSTSAKRLIILITTSSSTNLNQMAFPRYVWTGRRRFWPGERRGSNWQTPHLTGQRWPVASLKERYLARITF